jgi:pyruvate/2-oxoglutarate dehydrogenase complex dihydrolipoamide dehydrogenase (E3) component
MVNMSTPQQYDAIVIGSGQAGTPLCTALAGAGMRTALVEREHIGGTCINEGCTPTKTMVASGRVAYLARRGANYGVHTGALRIDMERIRQRKREIVASFRDGNQGRIEKTPNLDLIFGEASFTGPKSITVQLKNGSQCELTAGKFFINTGARPSIPSLDGLKDVPFLNSTSIMELDQVPEHLLVLGGGYVGLEFGQMFRRFGSRVTIVQSGAQLLNREDPDVAQDVAQILEQDGISVLLNAKASAVRPLAGGMRLEAQQNGQPISIDGSHLLVAVGRTPNSDTLKLAAADVHTGDHGFITVNDRLETTTPGIYALGDIKGGPAFTHISYDDFRIIRTNLIENGSATTAGRLVPYTVFIDPQLGRIGLTESEAHVQNKKYRVAKMAMSSVARALEVAETRGFMKAIVEVETGQILGAAVLGIEGGEIMSMLQLAMMGKLPYTTLREAVFAHPTLAESLNNLFYHFQS